VASSSISARRYAEAAFDIAAESEAFVAWSGDLRAIAEFCEQPDVAGVLRSGRVPRGEKRRLLEAGLAGTVSQLALNLALLLLERGRIELARDVQIAFQEKVDERLNIAHATVTTAVPLADDERNAVAAKLSSLTGKQVDVTPVVDEAIIGGVIARIGDQLIDGSTRTRLLALKRRLAGAAR
jgi:F-type H+-transporting ATPase subunit delta